MPVLPAAAQVAVTAPGGRGELVNGDVDAGAGPTRDGVPSFDSWVAARGHALVGFAYLVTADLARAEEAVQDALARAYGKWSQVCRAEDPEAYVRRMIVNADISGWRRFRKRETPVAEAIAAAAPSGVDVARSVTEEDAMRRLCAELPRRQRAAVVLPFYEDLPDAQIAGILGCSESTVRSQIHRALATLRANLIKETGRDG